METINLIIPGMKSPHCTMAVSGAVKSIGGAMLKKVTPGEAEIELSGSAKAFVVEAIEKAGNKVANK